MNFAQIAAKFLSNVRGHKAHEELANELRRAYIEGMEDALLLRGAEDILIDGAVRVATFVVISTNRKIRDQKS